MSNFSDREDRDLIQLTAAYESRNEKIVWSEVVYRMRYAKKEARVLQQRLTTLKNTYGKSLQSFPARFFQPLPLRAGVRKSPAQSGKAVSEIKKPVRLRHSDGPAVTHVSLESSCTKADEQQTSQTPTLLNTSTQAVPVEVATLTDQAAFEALDQIFRPVRKTDVLQAAGRIETNVGELSPRGTLKVIEMCDIQEDDVFVDIGSGIGNVVAQVAIQTKARLVIGLEMRADLVRLSRQLMVDGRQAFPALNRVQLIEGDITATEVGESVITQATVIFANNLLFTPLANRALHALCSQLPYLRLVLLGDRPCPRHRARCSNHFCLLWKETGSRGALETEFRSCPLVVTVFERRVRLNEV